MVLNVYMPLETQHVAFPIVKSKAEVKTCGSLDSFLYLPELASVVELGCAKEVCLLPCFLPLYKLFTTDLATRGFLSTTAEIRLLDFVLQIYRVFFFLPPP